MNGASRFASSNNGFAFEYNLRDLPSEANNFMVPAYYSLDTDYLTGHRSNSESFSSGPSETATSSTRVPTTQLAGSDDGDYDHDALFDPYFVCLSENSRFCLVGVHDTPWGTLTIRLLVGFGRTERPLGRAAAGFLQGMRDYEHATRRPHPLLTDAVRGGPPPFATTEAD